MIHKWGSFFVLVHRTICSPFLFINLLRAISCSLDFKEYSLLPKVASNQFQLGMVYLVNFFKIDKDRPRGGVGLVRVTLGVVGMDDLLRLINRKPLYSFNQGCQ